MAEKVMTKKQRKRVVELKRRIAAIGASCSPDLVKIEKYQQELVKLTGRRVGINNCWGSSKGGKPHD